MTFQHHRNRKLTVRKLSSIDYGRVFVHPLSTDLTTTEGQVFEIEDVTSSDDIVQIDLTRQEVYIYSLRT